MNIVFLDCTQGYGYAFSACNTKVELMARGLTEAGDRCYIHNGPNGKAGLQAPQYAEVPGVGQVVDYPCRHNWYINPLFNYRLLVSDLKRWHQSDTQNVVVLEAPYLPYYRLEMRAARQAGYKVAVIAHEWLATFRNRNKIRRWLAHRYSKVFGHKVDAILPISEYIIDKIQKFKKPYLKVPVLADFSTEAPFSSPEKYFAFCVSAEYGRVIEIVLRGFMKFHESFPDYKMKLILSGGKEARSRVSEFVAENGCSHSVDIKSGLPYDELKALYCWASGLVVALNPEFEQDKARFSQKIAEYLSSGVTLISNNVGEMPHYFTDRQNIVMGEYSSDGFCDSFSWIAENPEKAQSIGRAGYRLGEIKFNYKTCGKQLHDFLYKI